MFWIELADMSCAGYMLGQYAAVAAHSLFQVFNPGTMYLHILFLLSLRILPAFLSNLLVIINFD